MTATVTPSTTADSEVGLYVHIPFCSVKCFYCDFTAFSGQSKLAERYLDALEREAALMPRREPSTLYVGGGTPSELTAAQIDGLFAALRRAYPSARLREATFEGNPESLTQEKLAVLALAGVTRLSMGLQTADDSLLKGIGRKHSFADFVSVFRQARSVARFSISVDLMHSLPGQSLASLRETLDSVLALQPDHISLYGLQVEDRTLFAKRAVEPDEDLGRAMFELSLERLAAAGLRHYEISNFAKPGHESRHNQIYWRDGEYVGLGCGAASHLGGVRSTNVDRIQTYCEAVEGGRRPIADSERLAGREKLGEKAFLGLRLIDGFVPSPELRSAFAPQWERLRRRGLVRERDDRLALTREGVFLANQAFSEFVPPYSEANP